MTGGKIKAPLLRIAQKSAHSGKQAGLIRLAALLCAMLAISIMFLAMGYNPITVFLSMLYGAFGKKIFIQETIKITIPLVITAMGLSLAFKMKLWNIGGEGQILIGGAAATAVSIYLSDSLPHGLLLLLMGIAAIMAAGFYGLIPAVCKAKWDTNETLLTLMSNYIALQFIILLQNTKSWQDTANSYPKIRMLDMNSRLPKVFGIHIGWIMVLILIFVYYCYINKTKQGFEIKVIGDSRNTARYAGINVRKVMLSTMYLSAALCGLAGFLQVSGADGTLSEATSGGMGFTAITVVWMSHMNPVGMLMIALFISMLERGSVRIQTTHLIPASFANVMIGIILLFLMGCEFFTQYKLVFRKKVKQ